VTISDSLVTGTDSVTITLLDSTGKALASDANGTLTGTGLTKSSPGVYTLAANTPAIITTELNALSFHPVGTAPVTTGFRLDVTDAGDNPTTATDSKTSVIEQTPPPPPPPGGGGGMGGGSPSTGGNFLVADQTTGQTSNLSGVPHTGPVAGISTDIILATSDNINVTARIPNVFIHTGSGDDAIDVSGVNGNNIEDGGTGSNFLVGGTGNDTFYVDDRNAPSNIWSTVKGFHSGDNATIFGVTAKDFIITPLDNQGAVGATGLTFDLASSGKPDARITLAGFSQADLTSGRVTMTFGRTADNPGLPGSDFMLLHAT
jgi:hypothetical protein